MTIKTDSGHSPTGRSSAARASRPRLSLLWLLTALVIGGWGYQAAARTDDDAPLQRSVGQQSDIHDGTARLVHGATTRPIMNGGRLDDGQPLVDWP